ncbi:elongation factor P hydroxylase [Azospirillum oryzae]|uniref:Elongation factor P hydroxylase n=1 Tax=Azospirillum oryzae TaxID=286727 RepID=A0A6N1AI64_9PROT|nr:elongation factor P hydroxylase [Azospirillum oryzae]KAA0589581.1 elongation factor P hydroxylase [Azospirillum oryzae]QKS51421.1 elongation factor P hydroxylase [Azospirillum oryzae]GLR80544.1 hypothetical protein GCM10007856_32230 [Azospirillum oryzae]
MILTPIAIDDMPKAIAAFDAHLDGHAQARAAFRRIASTWPVRPADEPGGGVDTSAHRADAVRLAHAHGIDTLDEPPSRSFMWDGKVIRTDVEATVIVHEVAHWLCATPERRTLIDYGLGPGPETTARKEARADKRLCFEDCMHEEQQTSLLGVLWEVELGQPGILAFLEQNWMEHWERPSTAAFFIRHAEELFTRGLIDADGRPTTARDWADARQGVRVLSPQF